jgi:CRISPR-associated protein Cas1
MIKRTIYIGNPAYLKLQDSQLHVIDPETKQLKGTVPVEDIALLVLDNYRITLTNQLLVKLQSNNSIVVSCDAHHLPFAYMLPVYSHSEYSERLKNQIKVSEPLKKQLWKQIVIQKIKNQQAVLKNNNKPYEHLTHYWQNVKSGDTTNMEGIAAQNYWKYLFDDFQRDRFGEKPNNLLNFGYAVLRSIVARALVSSGLHPALGIFHKNKYNPYCLADDVMEAYRPFIDIMVNNALFMYQNQTELTKEIKSHLLTVATQDVFINQQKRPLMIAVTTTTASLYKCYTGELRNLKLPEIN